MGEAQGLFRSAASRARVLAECDRLLGRLEVPWERREVPTALGTTFVVDAGPRRGPPLLLVHGMGLCAGAYHPEINVLARTFRVVAPDLPGQPGRTAAAPPPPHGPGWGSWQVELLDALGIPSAAVFGHSLGGYVALKLAEHAPGRIRRLALVVPAGLSAPPLLRLGPGLLRLAWGRLLGKEGWAERLFDSAPGPRASADVLGFLELAVAHTRVVARPLPVLRPAQLEGFTAPSLVLPAQHDQIYDADRTAEGARRLLKCVKVERLEGHGHVYDDDRRRAVAQRLAAFLGEAA